MVGVSRRDVTKAATLAVAVGGTSIGLAARAMAADVPQSPPDLSEAEYEALARELTNWQTWGENSERGTLNHITQANVIAAAKAVRSGRTINIANPITRDVVKQTMVMMQVDSLEATDQIVIGNHGAFLTHIDAIGHMFFQGRLFAGKDTVQNVTRQGLLFGGVKAMREGVVTRAVFLDVARAKGVEFLPVGGGVTSADLELAEKHAGVKVGKGDAIVVRVGNRARAAASGQPEVYAPRTGMLPESLRWMKQRQIALWAGDCADRTPNPYPKYPWPFHIMAEAVMGLPLLHYIDAEKLATACREERRNEFMLSVAPLLLDTATGSPVSPLATF